MNLLESKELFTKYIEGTCTNHEIELLEAFLNSYQDKNGKEPLQKFSDVESSKDKIWTSILSEVEQSSASHKKYPLKRYSFYAAAAAVLVLFASTIFFQDRENIFSDTPIVNNVIQTGTDKATLTLSTGATVTLEKGKVYSNKIAESDGKSVVYNKKTSQEDHDILYNYLTIPRGGQFYLELSDNTKIWLNSDSKIKYPEYFIEGKPRSVELVYGEAFFDVSPSSQHNGDTFNVLSKGQIINVIGTQFNLRAYKDEPETYTTLAEGKINLAIGDNLVTLNPGEQAKVNREAGDIAVKNVTIYNEISWKDGVFSFAGKTLEDLMKTISRWYDVEVVFENKKIKTETFKGVLGKDQDIKEIMDVLLEASEISSYELKEKTIIIK
jgi:transmembrane sensor